MKRITVERPHGTRMIYATNDDGTGAFYRKPHEGAYRQLSGNAQTPIFKTPEQLREWANEFDAKIIESWGW
jgi:hypothetical protein